MNKKIIIYFIKNILISLILSIIMLIVILYLYLDGNFNDIGLILLLIPGIFYQILISLDLLFSNPILFFVLPYIIYYSVFIFIHYFLFKYKNPLLGYIFTIIITLINVYYGFKVGILMTS